VEEEMGVLEGRVAVVTGAGRGVGKAVALGYAREGADVVVVSRTLEQVERTAAEIEALGRRSLAMKTDVSDADAVRTLADKALSVFGRIDILVSNASPASAIFPVEDMPLARWREIQAINVEGTVLLLQAFGPGMLERGSGSVIIVTSTVGVNGAPRSSAYGASKAALNHLTRTVATEWGPRGVRVNALLPGPVSTERNQSVTADREKYEFLMSLMALKHFPVAEDMVGPAIFLASDASRCVTGHQLVVDNGISAVAREANVRMMG
jgi:NAD(P)-dependent dehydrogenase (short-subunit alcohol dehydrogenase family)